MRSFLKMSVKQVTTATQSQWTTTLNSRRVYTLSTLSARLSTRHFLPHGSESDRALKHPTSFLTRLYLHFKLWSPGLRNKVTDRLKLDVGHVVWTSINPMSLSTRPHLISTHAKTTNIYLSAIFRTDKLCINLFLNEPNTNKISVVLLANRLLAIRFQWFCKEFLACLFSLQEIGMVNLDGICSCCLGLQVGYVNESGRKSGLSKSRAIFFQNQKLKIYQWTCI
jgi:hypothetical protein